MNANIKSDRFCGVASCTVTTSFLIRTPHHLRPALRPRVLLSSPFPFERASIMSTDPGDRLVHQVRVPASPTSREPFALQGIAFTDSPTSDLYTQPHPSSSQLSQPVDLNMEVYSPTESRPESPSMPPSPNAMADDTQLGLLSIPIFLSTTDSFDQQSDVVTSSLHSIADWLETADWDAIFGRNPLDAATLNSSPLAAAATRVIRYLNAGITGRSTKVPELQVSPVQPNPANPSARRSRLRVPLQPLVPDRVPPAQ